VRSRLTDVAEDCCLPATREICKELNEKRMTVCRNFVDGFESRSDSLYIISLWHFSLSV
jgi:hypothetical protein